jgi:hypothetical protein
MIPWIVLHVCKSDTVPGLDQSGGTVGYPQCVREHDTDSDRKDGQVADAIAAALR